MFCFVVICVWKGGNLTCSKPRSPGSLSANHSSALSRAANHRQRDTTHSWFARGSSKPSACPKTFSSHPIKVADDSCPAAARGARGGTHRVTPLEGQMPDLAMREAEKGMAPEDFFPQGCGGSLLDLPAGSSYTLNTSGVYDLLCP